MYGSRVVIEHFNPAHGAGDDPQAVKVHTNVIGSIELNGRRVPFDCCVNARTIQEAVLLGVLYAPYKTKDRAPV